MKKFMFVLLLSLAVILTAQIESRVVVYEDVLEGSLTASGELFSQSAFTAAHEDLPLGTVIEVLNVQTDKKVKVVVNDRISDSPDLFWISKAAADILEISSGVPTEILYTVIGEVKPPEPSETFKILFSGLGDNLEINQGDPRIPRSEGGKVNGYGVQLYSASKRMDAVTLSRRFQEKFEYLSYFEKVNINGENRFRVVVGDFDTQEEALECYWKIQKDLPDIFLVEIY
jgi:peptidoglycan lytic transglycosylase